MIDFIDDQRGAYGGEPICKVLPIDPSTYHAGISQRRDPGKLSRFVPGEGRVKSGPGG